MLPLSEGAGFAKERREISLPQERFPRIWVPTPDERDARRCSRGLTSPNRPDLSSRPKQADAFSPRSLLRTSRPAQRRDLSSIHRVAKPCLTQTSTDTTLPRCRSIALRLLCITLRTTRPDHPSAKNPVHSHNALLIRTMHTFEQQTHLIHQPVLTHSNERKLFHVKHTFRPTTPQNAVSRETYI